MSDDIKTNDELVNQLITTNDSSDIENIINLFNFNMKKKNILRVNTYNNLLDKVIDEVVERFDKHSDEFSNKELLDYLNSIQTFAYNKQDLTDVQVPSITLNTINMTNNINSFDSIDVDSRKRIQDAIQNIINNSTVVVDSEEVISDE